MENINAKDIMTTNVVTVPEDLPLGQLTNLFSEKMISGAPVISKGEKLIGIVSLSDIVRSNGDKASLVEDQKKSNFYSSDLEDQFAKEDLEGIHLEIDGGLTVGDIMTPLVFSVSEATPLGEMAEIMSSGRIHRLIVTGEDRVVGIITTMDILTAISKKYKETN